MKNKNSKNKILWTMIIILFVIGSIIAYLYFSNKDIFNSDYSAKKTSYEEDNNSNNNNNHVNDSNTNNKDNNIESENTSNINNVEQTSPPPTTTEHEISSFTTKIYSTDSARQNNINITCSKLNNAIVKNGKTFSFCSTVGQATSNQGYQKADIFDKNGNKKKGLGGGNCQISTTLYNAILNVPNLTVTERHAHSNYVPYIQKGKDAAVAYGSYDLKFVNNTGNDVKILATSDGTNVIVKLISITYA
ncbi:MAG: VanW family protein [Clostridia bacterium]|nr:VanW family protein [Clostridia bacterium]